MRKTIPQGILGKDKRGASVLYHKYGKSDRGALVGRVGFDFFSCYDWRFVCTIGIRCFKTVLQMVYFFMEDLG